MNKLMILLILITFPWIGHASNINDFIYEQPVDLPDFSFTDDQGNSNSLNQFKGKVVLLNFWATWCPPCIKEMPALSALQESMKDSDVVIVPVSLDNKDYPAIKQFFDNMNITNLPAYLDKKQKSFKLFGIRALPTTYIINRSGKIIAGIMGEIAWNSKETKEFLLKIND